MPSDFKIRLLIGSSLSLKFTVPVLHPKRFSGAALCFDNCSDVQIDGEFYFEGFDTGIEVRGKSDVELGHISGVDVGELLVIKNNASVKIVSG